MRSESKRALQVGIEFAIITGGLYALYTIYFLWR